MKYWKIIILITLTSCNSQRRAQPCKQCPHYSTEFEIMEYLKLNPYPPEIAYEKPD